MVGISKEDFLAQSAAICKDAEAPLSPKAIAALGAIFDKPIAVQTQADRVFNEAHGDSLDVSQVRVGDACERMNAIANKKTGQNR